MSLIIWKWRTRSSAFLRQTIRWKFAPRGSTRICQYIRKGHSGIASELLLQISRFVNHGQYEESRCGNTLCTSCTIYWRPLEFFGHRRLFARWRSVADIVTLEQEGGTSEFVTTRRHRRICLGKVPSQDLDGKGSISKCIWRRCNFARTFFSQKFKLATLMEKFERIF